MWHRSRTAVWALVLTAAAPGQQQGQQHGEHAVLERVVVEGRADSQIGVADSASQGSVSRRELLARPIQRPGDVLEAVPGVITTQHSGAGKANQFFLRGFNLDHGTDLAIRFAGVPVNAPSHGHGQGYADLSFVIPELVGGVAYRKGPYDVRDGDFGSAGSIRLDYVDELERGFVRVGAGSYDYARTVFGRSFAVGESRLLVGGEVVHEDGPWQVAQDHDKLNGVLRYSVGDDADGWRLTALAYDGGWTATDQIPRRAAQSGQVARFGSLDTTDGGRAERFSVSADWFVTSAHGYTRANGYAVYSDLDLFSNFTYSLDDAANGDQFQQTDERTVLGFDLGHTWTHAVSGLDAETSVGLASRHDFVRNGLFRTRSRARLATVRSDRIYQGSVSAWAEHRIHWSDRLRTNVGVRGDGFAFDVDSDSAANSALASDGRISPKAGIAWRAFDSLELYANVGVGFHSNDARGVTIRDDPTTPAPLDGSRVPGLVRSDGAEVGVRTTALDELDSSLALFWLELDSELVFVGDAGNSEASRASRRFGLEWTNDYRPAPWLELDADVALTRARFRGEDPAGDRIPGSLGAVATAGVTVRSDAGHELGLRMRHFGERPLVEDNRVRASDVTLFSLRAGHRVDDDIGLSIEAFNLFDREANDIEYFYRSRLPGEPAGGVDDVHFHPVEPLSLRIYFEARF